MPRGLDHHLKTLRIPMGQWRNTGLIPPVILLTGLAGIGKKTVARYLGQWLLCETFGPSCERPCEKCSSCLSISQGLRLIELGSSGASGAGQEDSESDHSNTGVLKIDQFRKLKEKMGFGSDDQVSKVILIPSADRMTQQAGNSILKLLEEPPQGWVFILTCNDPALLLPTLVSRCIRLSLKPLSPSILEEILREKKIASGRVAICSALSLGSLGRALLLAEDENWTQRKIIAQFLAEPGKHLQNLIDWATTHPIHFDLLLDLVEQGTHDLILWSTPPQNGAHAWRQSDLVTEFQSHAAQVEKTLGSKDAARNFWVSQNERLSEIRLKSFAPVNRKLLTQDLLLPWLGVSA
ncbi:MAG: hypothetical protein HYX41_02825 [Bdellovibrio sp.]|nr:hypothetical protein [Bdellovibrio sp.]